MGGYRNSPMLFRTVPSPTPTPPFSRLEVCNPHPKLQSPIISGTGKATDFKFCTHIYTVNRNKSPWKILRNNCRGRSQGVQKIFRAPIYQHCAVIFAIAQLSCLNCSGLNTAVSGRWLKNVVRHCLLGLWRSSLLKAIASISVGVIRRRKCGLIKSLRIMACFHYSCSARCKR